MLVTAEVIHVPRGLIKYSKLAKHTPCGGHGRKAPCTNRLIRCSSLAKHKLHVSHGRSVPCSACRLAAIQFASSFAGCTHRRSRPPSESVSRQLSQHNFHLHRHFRLPFCSRHSITKFFYIALYKYRYEGDEGRSRRTQGQCKPRPRWNDELTARLRLSVTRVREGTPALPKTCTPLVPRGTIEAGTDLRYTGMVL